MNSIVFQYPGLPPSVNDLYKPAPGGWGLRLSKEGVQFKNRFVSERGGVSVAELMAFEAEAAREYLLELWFFVDVDDLYNKTFSPSNKVKSPFKKFDVSNLIKITEDCISDLVGIDDKANFSVLSHKREAHDFTGIVARVQPLSMAQELFPAPIRPGM